MKKLKTFIITIILFCFSTVYAQSFEEVIKSVLINNTRIQANNNYLNKLNIEAKTGLTLNNPTISYAHLWDKNDATGFGEEFEVAQSFEFPSSYAFKNIISNLEIEKTEDRRKLFSLEILLETQQTCIEIVYYQKKKNEIGQRLQYAGQLVENIQSKLENGFTTQFELDKAKISELAVQNHLIEIENSLQKNLDHLTALNGGIQIAIPTGDYPGQIVPNNFDELFEQIESIDPLNKLIELEIKIAELNIKLTRTGSLPEFEVGYKTERNALDKMAGVHLGMSIPLWQNKNKVQGSIINMEHMKSNIIDHENEHYFHTKSIYDEFVAAKGRLEKFQNLWNQLNYLANIEKALAEGEISSTEYFIELKSLYEIKDKLLDIEKDYQLLLSQLNKYGLLKYL